MLCEKNPINYEGRKWPTVIIILKHRYSIQRIAPTLFIDASEMGFMKDRTHREFSPED